MKTYILTWNPKRWKWDDFDAFRARVAAGIADDYRWSTGNNKSIRPGERFFLFRQGSERGIIGAGRTTSYVYHDEHWDDASQDGKYVDVQWDTLLPIELVLPIHAVMREA